MFSLWALLVIIFQSVLMFIGGEQYVFPASTSHDMFGTLIKGFTRRLVSLVMCVIQWKELLRENSHEEFPRGL